jgi:hypothetical protein
MEQEANLGKLASLEVLEAKLLLLKCRGRTQQQISLDLDIGTGIQKKREKAVGNEMRKVYKKLGFPSDMRRGEVQEENLKPYRELLNQHATTLESIDERWPPEWLLILLAQVEVEDIGEFEVEDIGEVEEERKEVEVEPELEEVSGEESAEEPPQDEIDAQPDSSLFEIEEPNGDGDGNGNGNGDGDGEVGEVGDGGRRNLWIGIIIGGVVIVCCIGILGAWQFYNWLNRQSTEIAAVTDIPPSPIPPPSDTPLPSFTSSVTLTPTETQSPTITLSPALTPTPTITHTPTIEPTWVQPGDDNLPLVFEGEYDLTAYAPRLMILNIDTKEGDKVAGTILFPDMGRITGWEGVIVHSFDDVTEQAKWYFIEEFGDEGTYIKEIRKWEIAGGGGMDGNYYFYISPTGNVTGVRYRHDLVRPEATIELYLSE